MTDLRRRCSAVRCARRSTVLAMPDFADLHRKRQQHSHVTQQLVWEEYRQANPDGYQYSRFCELHQQQDVVLRQEHKVHNGHRIEMKGESMRKNRGKSNS